MVRVGRFGILNRTSWSVTSCTWYEVSRNRIVVRGHSHYLHVLCTSGGGIPPDDLYSDGFSGAQRVSAPLFFCQILHEIGLNVQQKILVAAPLFPDPRFTTFLHFCLHLLRLCFDVANCVDKL